MNHAGRQTGELPRTPCACELRLSPVLPDQGMQPRYVQRLLAVAYEVEHDLACKRKGPPGRMGRKTALIILHGSKHSVLGASARRPVLVYKAATSEGKLRRIHLPRTSVNKGNKWRGQVVPRASSKR